MSAFLSMDLDACRLRGHHFSVVGSDKTPLKRSLMCLTCTAANPGKSAYCAYGLDTQSWGQWMGKRRHEAAEAEETEID